MRKVFNRKVRTSGDGVNVVADVNAVVTANVGRGGTSSTSARRRVRITQRRGRPAEVVEEVEESG